MKKLKTFLFLWGPPIVWCGLIFYLSSIQGLETGKGGIHTILRKIAHLTEYAILYLLFFRSLIKSRLEKKKAYLIGFILSFLYAISDEVHQHYVPTRDGRIADILTDVIGMILGFVVILKYRKFRNLKSQMSKLKTET